MNKTLALLATAASIALVSPAFAQTNAEDEHQIEHNNRAIAHDNKQIGADRADKAAEFQKLKADKAAGNTAAEHADRHAIEHDNKQIGHDEHRNRELREQKHEDRRQLDRREDRHPGHEGDFKGDHKAWEKKEHREHEEHRDRHDRNERRAW